MYVEFLAILKLAFFYAADDMDQLEELLNQADDQLLDTLKRYNQFVEPRSEVKKVLRLSYAKMLNLEIN